MDEPGRKGRPREEEAFDMDRGDRSSVSKELREQGTRDEDLVSIVPHNTRSTSESLAKTSEVHEEPIKSII